jgi:predicted signal transduction protein with EAL and GGDEF domain
MPVSVAELRRLACKVTQSFVQAMTTDASPAIIDLADALRLPVVAEGVEDCATWDVLGGLGCEVAQGYFLSRPIGATERAATSARPIVHKDALSQKPPPRHGAATAMEGYPAAMRWRVRFGRPRVWGAGPARVPATRATRSMTASTRVRRGSLRKAGGCSSQVLNAPD